jgi:hypothetical protein
MYPARRTRTFFARRPCFTSFTVLVGLGLLAAQCARSQEVVAVAPAAALSSAPEAPKAQVDFESSSANALPAEGLSLTSMEGASAEQTPKPAKQPPEREIIYEGLASYGHYKIFASGTGEKLYVGGVEYDRHSWGSLLGGEMDYVAEVLPFVLLNKPLHIDIYGNPDPKKLEGIRQYVPGFGFSPIGFRLQWFSKRRIKPYLEAKGGVIVFTKKVPSTEASYENFSLQSGTGVQVKINERWGVRLGLFSDFHFSNAFIVPINPGLDVMNANLGISYHLGHRGQ